MTEAGQTFAGRAGIAGQTGIADHAGIADRAGIASHAGITGRVGVAAELGITGELGIVVIGRNEGPRLRACLQSLPLASRPSAPREGSRRACGPDCCDSGPAADYDSGPAADYDSGSAANRAAPAPADPASSKPEEGALSAAGVTVVYVDSGSTDASVEIARAAGAIVIELDPSRPFSAARARNAGWRRLCELRPSVAFIQFIDGDCTLAGGWLPAGVAHLKQHPGTVGVCGRLREKRPQESVFNLLCHIEWDGPAGEIEEFGGIVLLRRDALEQAGGYIESVIAAEDTELSARLRKAGGRLERVDVEMAQHDAHMQHVGQWWKRAVRSGHAHAEMNVRHGGAPIYCRTRACRSNWLWGLLLPALALALAGVTGGSSLVLLLAYPLQYLRILTRSAGRMTLREAHWFALFCVLGKFPETLGQIRFWLNRLRGRQTSLIEYKHAAPAGEPVRA